MESTKGAVKSIKSLWISIWRKVKKEDQIDQPLLMKERGTYEKWEKPGRKERPLSLKAHLFPSS
jgi:hypothetical protein